MSRKMNSRRLTDLTRKLEFHALLFASVGYAHNGLNPRWAYLAETAKRSDRLDKRMPLSDRIDL